MKNIYLILGIAGLTAAVIVGAVLLKALNSPPARRTALIGIWIWDRPQDMAPQEDERIASLLSSSAIDIAYLNINDYVDLYENRSDPERQSKMESFTRQVKDFVKAATARNVQVEALAGSPEWGNSSLRYLNGILIDYVRAYNQSASPDEHLSGIQFDIEPYHQTDFSSDQKTYLSDYLDTLDFITQKMSESDKIKLGATVPYWYDGQNKDYAQFVWRGRSSPYLQHILGILSGYGRSYIAIMSYRREPGGANGTLSISKPSIEMASAAEVESFIGQETTDVSPQSITFYGGSKSDLKDAITQILSAYRTSPFFSGVIVHDLRGFEALK